MALLDRRRPGGPVRMGRPRPGPDPDDDILAGRGTVGLRHAIARPSEAATGDLDALGRLVGNATMAGLVAGRAAGPDASAIQREAWGAQYRTRRARPGALPYEEYKARIGQPGEAESFAPPLQAASEWGGHRLAPVAMTRDELGQILLPERKDDPDAVAAHEQRLDTYLSDINAAFDIMQIDTVEAQADYLGHAAGESGTLARLGEVGAENRDYAPFQGRGPVQVTWEAGYVQTLAYLETQADRLSGQADAADAAAPAAGAEATPDAGAATTDVATTEVAPASLRGRADLARRAVAAIRKDPAEAANPEFAFLFSAAFMQMSGGVRSSARLRQTAGFAGNSAEDRWVTGRSTSFATGLDKAIAAKDTGAQADLRSAINRARVKRETYARAVLVLWPRVVKEGDAAEPGE